METCLPSVAPPLVKASKKAQKIPEGPPDPTVALVQQVKDLLKTRMHSLTGNVLRNFREGLIGSLIDLPYIQYAGKCRSMNNTLSALEGRGFSEQNIIPEIEKYPETEREAVTRKLLDMILHKTKGACG